MTRIENIPHILEFGITHATSPNANPAFVPMGDKSLIKTRNNFVLDNGTRLGDYTPFYFGWRTPMLYVVQKGYNLVAPAPAETIIYCVTSVQEVIRQGLDFLFTDGHAVDSLTTQYAADHIENIETIIDWKAVKARYWKDEADLDLKRRKEAEFLIRGDLAVSAILGYVVYNEAAKKSLEAIGVTEKMIVIKPEYYF